MPCSSAVSDCSNWRRSGMCASSISSFIGVVCPWWDERPLLDYYRQVA
ncbi:MAG: hypothetical protein IPM39_10285 [Chloroflexi bacterium]|nr:hypothetical protein [Chloroflexota bacterium]